MGWREWFGLKLSPEQFANLVIKRAKKLEPGEYRYAPHANEVIKGPGEGTGTIFLGRVHDQYRQAPRRHRNAVVDRFLSSMAATPENTIPPVYAEARPRILPIVRDRIDLSIGKLMAGRFSTDKPAPSMAALPFVDRLIAGLAFDTPNAIHRLTEQHLQEWAVDIQAVLDDALDNLRATTKPGGWSQLDEGVWSGEWDDAYASSRMLTPEIIHQVGLADPLVMVPCPEFILMVDGNRPGAFEALGAMAKQAAEKGKRQLSMVVYRLREKLWEVAPIPDGQGEVLHILQLHAVNAAYADQKQLLDDLYARRKVDVFIASHQLVENDRGVLQSMGIWTEGVETLLPHADLLVLQEFDHARGCVLRRIFVPFAELHGALPNALQAVEGLDPPRYQPQGFPGKDVWQKLEALAVTIPLKKG